MDPHFLKLLSLVWIDAKDWRIADFQNLTLAGSGSILNLAALDPRRSPRVFQILKTPYWWKEYQVKLDRALDAGIHWLPFFDPNFPDGLCDLDTVTGTAPIGVWVQGEWRPEDVRLSVVGSRAPVQGIPIWMKAEVEPVREAPWTLVSGGAQGVDFWAHELCLHRDSPTVVVLPSGILNPYPRDWFSLRKKVLDSGGCFISEYDCGMEIRKFHFHARNRLIAALSPATLILQAALKSGTWMTAHWAVKLSRHVLVLPGPGWDRRFAGSHELIRTDQNLVTSRAEIAAFLKRPGALLDSSANPVSHTNFCF